MPDRRTYLYRLNVQLPPGSDEPGWEPPGWSDDPEHKVQDPETGGYETADFSWPALRAYLSPAAANRRATLLRRYGAVVTVERSEPIAWSARQIGGVDA